MLELSWESNIYPSNLRMPDVVQREQYPVMRSHFGDIYKGSYRGKAVCIEYHDASQTPLLYKVISGNSVSVIETFGHHRLSPERLWFGISFPMQIFSLSMASTVWERSATESAWYRLG
jgi:hypothetical protein